MKIHDSRSTHDRRGGATLAALVVVMLVFGLCMGLLQVTNGVTNRLRASVDQKRAFHLAEAGLAEAYAGIAMAKTGNVGTPAAPAAIGGGMFWVEADDLGNGIVSLESTAIHGRGRSTLRLTVRRPQPMSTALGLFSNRELTIKGNSFLDSFNSLNGTYAEHVAAGTNNQSIVGSNSNVTLHNNCAVMGDLLYGSGASVDLKQGAYVAGAIGSRATPAQLAPVEVPDIELGPEIEVERNQTLVIPPGIVGYESITGSRDGQLILTGPLTLVVEDFEVESHGSVTFDDSGGPIEIFVTDEFELSAGSSATTVSGDPRSVSIQVASDEDRAVTLGARSRFFGQIYAPFTSVKILPMFELFGSLVADELDITAQSRLHFDLATREQDTQSLPQLFAWQVVDIPDAVASRTSNLYRHLEIDRRSLLAPSDSHADQELSVSYRDARGVSRTYTGSEHAFDWTDVSELLSGTRDGVRFYAPDESGARAGDEEEEENDGQGDAPNDGSDAEDRATLDLIESAATSSDLAQELMARYPLSEALLLAAIQRVPAMDSDDLYAVLVAYGPESRRFGAGQAAGPASDTILMAAIHQTGFEASEITSICEQNSPLSESVLEALIDRSPALTRSQLRRIFRAQ